MMPKPFPANIQRVAARPQDNAGPVAAVARPSNDSLGQRKTESHLPSTLSEIAAQTRLLENRLLKNHLRERHPQKVITRSLRASFLRQKLNRLPSLAAFPATQQMRAQQQQLLCSMQPATPHLQTMHVAARNKPSTRKRTLQIALQKPK